ncbi:methyltransferase domain-containing protein [Streptomyces sp. V2]|uniref:methyltransferase domain-containing protein n=1 Tax=Streptomyces TaxID=1883 RepID=UPI000B1F9115|nr:MULTISPECIES: methyltransferase domain-containing protein [Streptomyces]PWG15470.1 methyltransferase domain-containing protein [Streptomyces sp. V2]
MSKNQETRGTAEKHRRTEAVQALLDAMDQMPSAGLLRARSYELLSLVPGSSVVDIGCGAGRAVAEPAERGVHAVGVDPDPWMLAEARKRWPAAEFREAGAEELPFADGSVHGYRADKVFHALQEPWRAVAEARRVLCPGGRIVLVGQDWDAVMVDSDDAELTRTIVHARADVLSAPRAGRQYRNLLLDGGFDDVTVEVHTSVFTIPRCCRCPPCSPICLAPDHAEVLRPASSGACQRCVTSGHSGCPAAVLTSNPRGPPRPPRLR